MPASVFISYARADRATVKLLVRDLQQRGFITWTDEEDISPGVHRPAATKVALELASIFLVALSPDWAASEIKLAGLQLAIDLYKPIVPIMLRPTAVPALLKIQHYIDFAEQPYPQAIDRIVKLLKVIAAPPAAETQPDRPAGDPAADQPAQKIVNRSGGATINADVVNIYGDVMGRDKRSVSTIFQAPHFKRLMLPLFALVLIAFIWVMSNIILARVYAARAALPTAVMTAIPTARQQPTPWPTATSTLPATDTPSPTLTPVPLSPVAVANRSAAIFLRPESASPQVGSVAAQTSVTITGRSAVGNWFYIHTTNGLRGFVYGPYFDWRGDPKSLPVVAAPIGPAASPAVTPRPVDRSITLDFYPLDPKGYCNSNGFPAYQLFMRGQGSIGPFTYYIENQFVGSSSDQLIYAYVFTQPGQTFITGRVTTDDGRMATKRILLSRPTCVSIGGRLIDSP